MTVPVAPETPERPMNPTHDSSPDLPSGVPATWGHHTSSSRRGGMRWAAIGHLSATVLFTLLSNGASLAQESPPEPLVIPKMEDPEVFDGRAQDPAWDQALSLPMVQWVPDFGAEPSQPTEILIGYSDEYLYMACRCYDSEAPSATTYRRNFNGADSDFIGLTLDTFNDNENALSFMTGPTGFRTDVSVANDAEGEAALDFDWNAAWEAEAHENEEGWFAELRIPIATLRFEADEGRAVMGLIAMRYRVRNQEVSIYPDIRPDWAYGWWKVSQARKVVLEDLEPRRLLQVAPFALAGRGRQSTLARDGTGYVTQTEPALEVGLDMKYGLADNLTLDLTVNTDFAQVEADDQEVNLTRFSLFFPERRQFFQERSSNFAFDFGGTDRLFYTRRIGLHEGQPVRILGGARLVGRSGPWDIGILNMQTAREPGLGLSEEEALAAENFGLARLRRQVINPFSYVGTILTSRVRRDGAYNVSYGLDGIFRLAGDDYLSVKWAQTFDDAVTARPASLDAGRIHLQWERRSFSGISYDLRYDRAGPAYLPAAGFQLRQDYFRLGDRISYGWHHGPGSSLDRQRVDLVTDAVFRNSDGSLESLEVGPQWFLARRGGSALRFGLTHRVEDLAEPFFLFEDLAVPEGRHSFQSGEVNLTMPPGMPLRSSVGISGGGFYDGWIASLQLSPTWNASRHVRASGFYRLDRIGFPDRDEAGTSHVGRLRLELTPSVRYSLQTFVQYNSAADLAVGNVRLRYNPREGTDFYIVFNEQMNTGRATLTPRPPRSGNRTLLVKYTYSFGN